MAHVTRDGLGRVWGRPLDIEDTIIALTVSILLGVWSCGIMLRLSTENGGQRDWRGHAGKTLLLHTHIMHAHT